MTERASNAGVTTAGAAGTATAPHNQQRRLSFIDSESQTNSEHKQRQSQAVGASGPPIQQQLSSSHSSERRQSIWNAPGGAGAGGAGSTGGSMPRKSVYQRRMSYAHSQGSRKSSQDLSAGGGAGYSRIRLANTYRTEPNSDQEKFKPFKLEPKLYAVLEEALKEKKYDPNKSAQLTKELSQIVMRETRLLMNASSPRYKLVSHVLVGEMKNQDIRHGSRCLWDNNLDNFVSVVYKNSSLFAVATVFALYYE